MTLTSCNFFFAIHCLRHLTMNFLKFNDKNVKSIDYMLDDAVMMQ